METGVEVTWCGMNADSVSADSRDAAWPEVHGCLKKYYSSELATRLDETQG